MARGPRSSGSAATTSVFTPTQRCTSSLRAASSPMPGSQPSTSSHSRPPASRPVLTTSAMPPAHSRGGSVSSRVGSQSTRLRLPERAHVVLRGHVDRRLAADRRVDLADERRRDRKPGHAAAERGSGEAADVGDGTAAGAHDHVAALELALGQGAPEALQRRRATWPPRRLASSIAPARASVSARSTIATAPSPSAVSAMPGRVQTCCAIAPATASGDSSPATIASAAAR